MVRLLQIFEGLEERMDGEHQFFKIDIVLQPGAGVKVAFRKIVPK